MVSKKFLIIFLGLIFLGVFIWADTQTTTMTWVIASAKSHQISYSAACSTTAFYFVETDANQDPDTDGNAAIVRPNSSSSGGAPTICQSFNLAPITISNTGNTTEDINADLNAVLTGADWNALTLKVWMGTGSGCGGTGNDTNGWGGWQKDCTVTAAGSPVTSTTCRTFNFSNATTSVTLVDNLIKNDSNQLCFSGDMNGELRGAPAAGSYERIFTTRTN